MLDNQQAQARQRFDPLSELFDSSTQRHLAAIGLAPGRLVGIERIEPVQLAQQAIMADLARAPRGRRRAVRPAAEPSLRTRGR
jgi:hypothetical protein